MRSFNHFRRITLLFIALSLMSFTVGHAKSTNDYKFKVHNNTKHTIKKVLVSEDGKTYGFFNIGDGIEAGATEELVWDKSTGQRRVAIGISRPYSTTMKNPSRSSLTSARRV